MTCTAKGIVVGHWYCVARGYLPTYPKVLRICIRRLELLDPHSDDTAPHGNSHKQTSHRLGSQGFAGVECLHQFSQDVIQPFDEISDHDNACFALFVFQSTYHYKEWSENCGVIDT